MSNSASLSVLHIFLSCQPAWPHFTLGLLTQFDLKTHLQNFTKPIYEHNRQIDRSSKQKKNSIAASTSSNLDHALYQQKERKNQYLLHKSLGRRQKWSLGRRAATCMRAPASCWYRGPAGCRWCRRTWSPPLIPPVSSPISVPGAHSLPPSAGLLLTISTRDGMPIPSFGDFLHTPK